MGKLQWVPSQEIEDLAADIAAEEGISLDAARQAARELCGGLRAEARAYDQDARAARDMADEARRRIRPWGGAR